MRQDVRYNVYSDYLKDKYGEKVYKLPVNIKATCPNRDGTKGEGGCIFCGARGSGLENLPDAYTVTEQLQKNIDYIGKRYGADKYIAYFQNFTNTYVPYEEFMGYAKEAAEFSDVVELAFSTRPDCIDNGHLKGLFELSRERGKQISIELGLQSANYRTLKKTNRGHSLAEFIDAVQRVKSFGFEVGAHVILNLPWDDADDTVETAKILSALRIDHVKLHSLYVERNTKLCEMYENHMFEPVPMEEYVNRAVQFLEYLSPDIVIQRIASRAPSKDTVFCNWGTGWWKIRDRIELLMEEKETRQGAKFDYLKPCEPKKHILVLWDIDGTLMHCGSNGTKALNMAMKELFDIDNAMAGAKVGSAMDRAILQSIMQSFNIDESEKQRIIDRFVKKLREILDMNTNKRVLPGITELLQYIEANSHIHSAILTSNFKEGAKAKLQSVGLWDYFEIGGFGDEEGEKWHAAENAVNAAKELYGCCFANKDIYVVGDSKYDIDCAKKLGFKSIAVATGWMEKDVMMQHEPDYMFDDLGEYEAVINIWEGG